MKPHICVESKTCVCGITADEPDEKCPVHGAGEWPPRCCICERFMKRDEGDYMTFLEGTTMRDPSPLGL
jgi:hypothetical protein